MIAVYTRSAHPVLWERMCEFIPKNVPKYRCTGFDGFTEAVDYLYYMFNHAKTPYILNIDEDCFVTDWVVLCELIEYFIKGEYTHAGMPDGGVHPGRTRSWAVQNPFFNIFYATKCKRLIVKKGRVAIDKYTFSDIGSYKEPVNIETCNHDNDEPFTGLFYYLHDKGNPLNLEAKVWEDGLTTELLFNGKPFCVHTWYSRNYGTDIEVTNRIDKIYEDCRNRVLVG
jgi:hypothetical protein